MSGHVADRAGFLAALAMDDPERRDAEEYAGSCAPCREALGEGQRLVALLAEALPLPPPTPAALERAASAIDRETAAERASWRLMRWAASGALVAVWFMQIFYGKHLVGDLRGVTGSLAVLAVAIVGVMFVGFRQRLVAVAMVVTSGVLAYVAGTAAGLETRAGVECTACELVAALIPWLVVIGLASFRRVPLDRSTTMGVAAAGAVASQAGQLLSCPVGHANPHLLLFHFGGVLLAVALGAINPIRVSTVAVARQ